MPIYSIYGVYSICGVYSIYSVTRYGVIRCGVTRLRLDFVGEFYKLLLLRQIRALHPVFSRLITRFIFAQVCHESGSRFAHLV
jgi:hypothetical protein